MTIYIEIAIVILMAFLLLSLIVTAVTELIASLLKLRAASLRRALAQILSDEQLKEKFYKNRLLFGTRTDVNGSKDKALTRWNHPSYIAPQAFARALLLALSKENGQSTSLAEQQQLSSLVETAKNIESEPLKQLLLGLIDGTKKSISELEKDIATWYDSATDRLSGYFKRQQQVISFFVGLAFAALFNIDILTLAFKVHSDEAVRAQLAASAEAYVAAQCVLGDECAKDAFDKIEHLSKDLTNELKGIALGWPDWPDWVQVLKHVPGWILAAFASTLGAPLWFDLLSRFVQIRGTGRKPQLTDVSERHAKLSVLDAAASDFRFQEKLSGELGMLLIATGQFEGRGDHVMRGRFRIEEDADGKVWFTTSDDFFFDGSPAPGFAISVSGNLTEDEATATDFLRLPGTGSGSGTQLEVRGVHRAEIPAAAGIKIKNRTARAVFLWCHIFPSVLGTGKIEYVQ